MEYTFGTINSEEYVRVKGIDNEFVLSGFQTISTTYPDCIITHNFKVRRLLKRTDNYIWYIIDNHTKYIDKSPALEAENKKLQQQIQALSDQNEFQEELIVELANVVYA